jgi:hypothetical protein
MAGLGLYVLRGIEGMLASNGPEGLVDARRVFWIGTLLGIALVLIGLASACITRGWVVRSSYGPLARFTIFSLGAPMLLPALDVSIVRMRWRSAQRSDTMANAVPFNNYWSLAFHRTRQSAPLGGDVHPRHSDHMSCNIHTISALRSLFGTSIDGIALFPQVPLLPFRTLVSRSPIA